MTARFTGVTPPPSRLVRQTELGVFLVLMALLPSDKCCVRIFEMISTFYFSFAFVMIGPYAISMMPLWINILGDINNTPEGDECTTASRQEEIRDSIPEGDGCSMHRLHSVVIMLKMTICVQYVVMHNTASCRRSSSLLKFHNLRVASATAKYPPLTSPS